MPMTICCEVFADVNAIYFTPLRWIMNAYSGLETLKKKNRKMHFNNILTMKMN